MTVLRNASNRRLISTVLATIALAIVGLVTVQRVARAGQEATAKTQPPENPKAEDVGSLQAIVASLYDSISGPAGQRDWRRLRSLFLPGARLIPSRHQPDGANFARVLSVEEFINAIEPRIRSEGFFEREIHRRVERFGSVAHVFSSYESKHARDDARPFVRGINSIQLFFDGKRWWVVTIFWDSERPDQEIPAEYLPGK